MRVGALCLFLGLAACASPPKVKPEGERKAEIEEIFAGTEGCFLLYNLKTKNFESIYNKKYCYERTAPASTFKIPLAAMAIDAGLILDKKTPFRWDGVKRKINSWNEDQTAASWLKNSTVWVSGIITKKLGRKKVQAYLKKFGYGNRDFSGDIEAAWLTASPEEEEKGRRSTVKITAYEQIDFLEALYTNELPVSAKARELTRSLIDLDESSRGFHLSGKTGSGYVRAGSPRRLGWFVAHLVGNGKEYLVATRFADLDTPAEDAGYAGPRAREITEQLLHSAGLW
ncbi:MAG: class D beta-lactamase [Proteobacteria bacterium]|nr:MAG: class D beta-lactamase [Pseudomonadota bacterium]